jgi:DNA polymerase III gamma/tau subunit
LLILSVDRSRADDPEIAAEGERDRLKHLTDLSSREDLLRAFDALTKAEQEIRVSDQPRYNLEMTLLRLMHLRKLVPLTELLGGAGVAGVTGGRGAAGTLGVAAGRSAAPGVVGGRSPAGAPRAIDATGAGAVPAPRAFAPAAPAAPAALAAPGAPAAAGAPAAPVPPVSPLSPAAGGALKDAFLAQVKASKVFFYNTVVAQAYRVEVTPSKITFTFLANQKVPKQQCEDMKPFLETIAQRVAGQKIPVTVAVADAAAAPGAPAPAAPGSPSPPGAPSSAGAPASPGASASPGAPAPAAPGSLISPVSPQADEAALREEAMADPSVQALFEIFPVEKSKVEEM